MNLKRPHLTLAVPFAVFPPNDIKSRRLFYFYSHLATRFNIEIISLADPNQPAFQGIIAPGLTEIRVPKSIEHQQAEIKLNQELGGNIADASLIKNYNLTPEYVKQLKASAKKADLLATYQPYLLPALKFVSNKPIWYEAGGFERELKKKILPENYEGEAWMESICEVEQECCKVSELIIVASTKDRENIAQIEGVEESKIVCVPNGINGDRFDFTPYEQRLANKEKLGLKDSFLAIFSGTAHPNNPNEARSILNLASKFPEINFLFLGEVGLSLQQRLTPPNVGFIPGLDRQTRSIILSLADVALNPIKIGCDNKSPILEYFCRGIPVISTLVGVENLGVIEDEHCFVGEFWRFPEFLVYSQNETIAQKKNKLENVREYIRNKFEWGKIANEFLNKIESLDLNILSNK